MSLICNNALIPLIALCIISCSTKRTKQSIEGTICPNEKQQVETDLKNGKLVYCIYTSPKLQPMRYKDEMSRILLKHHITIEDIRSNGYADENCYCQLMEDEIEKRFGKDFIPQVKQTSDSQFLAMHADTTLEPWICDSRPLYPGSSDWTNDDDIFQSRFDSLVKYPKGYQNKSHSASFDIIYVELTVKKTGDIAITKFTPLIRNKNNKRFEKYLEDQIRETLPLQGWHPAMILNQPVNCAIGLSIHLK